MSIENDCLFQNGLQQAGPPPGCWKDTPFYGLKFKNNTGCDSHAPYSISTMLTYFV